MFFKKLIWRKSGKVGRLYIVGVAVDIASNGGDRINTAIDHTGETGKGASIVNGVKTVAKEYVRQVAFNKKPAEIKNA